MFVVPANGRANLTRICLRQLQTTCEALQGVGVQASAIVVANDQNLDSARQLGFGWVKRDNRFLGRKFNDGIQLALDKHVNPRPADYVVPCGSDDWIDWQLFTDLPEGRTMVGFQTMSFVREDGLELTGRTIGYQGGCGIRIFPSALMREVGFRPCDEDRRQGCDTSILVNLTKAKAIRRIEHRQSDPFQIVDWKSPGEQINSYEKIDAHHRAFVRGDPFELLRGHYDEVSLQAMAQLYKRRPALVLA